MSEYFYKFNQRLGFAAPDFEMPSESSWLSVFNSVVTMCYSMSKPAKVKSVIKVREILEIQQLSTLRYSPKISIFLAGLVSNVFTPWTALSAPEKCFLCGSMQTQRNGTWVKSFGLPINDADSE